jgi:hypothetical protein
VVYNNSVVEHESLSDYNLGRLGGIAVTTELKEQPMAKKAETSIRISAEAADIAGKAARLKGIPLSKYVSDILLSIATKDLQAEARKIVGKDKPTS